MDFLRNLPQNVATFPFSEAIKGFVLNPLFKTLATVDDKVFLQSVILEYPWIMHYTAIEDYLRVTEDFDLAMFYVDSFVSLEPSKDEIAHNDRRAV